MSTKQVKVFVVDGENKPLLPTTPRRARKLLDAKKAKVALVIPFTIRLNRIIDNPVGSFTVGADDGAKKVGDSIRSLKAKAITLRTKWDGNFPVSYSKTKLIQRPNGLIYLY
jgi:hypothetical protein